MTILEFKTTNPSDYGAGNINLLYSSSVSTGSQELPSGRYPSVSYDSSSIDSNGDTVYFKADAYFPPYQILGLTIPFQSTNAVSLESTLNQVTSIKFTINGEEIETPVIQISKQNQYFYLETTPTSISVLPVEDDVEGTPTEFSVEFIFFPYVTSKFDNSDFNALQGNATAIIKSTAALEVDRDTDNINPSNLDAIISKTATPAQIQYSNYTTTGWSNARYSGTKLDSGSVPGDDPAMTFKFFRGSIHPLDSNVATIIELGTGDPGAKTIYFKIDNNQSAYIQSQSLEHIVEGTFPSISGSFNFFDGSILFEEIEGRFIRLVDKKIHAADKGSVFITDQDGKVTSETTGSA